MPDPTPAVLRVQLQGERDRLRQQLRELGRGSDDELAFDGGFADSSQVTAERGEMEAISGTITDKLREIDEALVKLEDGTYGRCQECGGEIGEPRLEAMPAAVLCITCASKSR